MNLLPQKKQEVLSKHRFESESVKLTLSLLKFFNFLKSLIFPITGCFSLITIFEGGLVVYLISVIVLSSLILIFNLLVKKKMLSFQDKIDFLVSKNEMGSEAIELKKIMNMFE